MGKIINGFYEFQLRGYTEFGKVKDFCFINVLLEKVVVDVITEKEKFLEDNSNDETEEVVFEHPNIPKSFETAVSFLKPNKLEYQCKNK